MPPGRTQSHQNGRLPKPALIQQYQPKCRQNGLQRTLSGFPYPMIADLPIAAPIAAKMIMILICV